MAYGFEIRDGSNTIVVDNTDATLRLVHREYIPYGFNGSRLIPAFNQDNGVWFYRAHITPCIPNFPSYYSLNTVYDSVVDVDNSFPSRDGPAYSWAGYLGLTGTVFDALTISFDNASKLLTVSGNYVEDWNGGDWSTTGNFEIVFMEYK